MPQCRTDQGGSPRSVAAGRGRKGAVRFVPGRLGARRARTGVAMQVPFLLRALRTTALEATALASHVLLYPTGVLKEGPLPLQAGAFRGPRPVVLLHGFIDNRSVFAVLRRSLGQHGWQTVVGVNYSPLTGDVRAAAAVLAAQVEEVRERTGHQQVDIVSHSLGGLVARYYVQRLGGGEKVHSLVTLGTPHLGTRAVPLLSVHPIVRQIRPDSDMVRELAEPITGCRTRFISFWSDLDPVMAPTETARLCHEDLRVCEVPVQGIGHLAMPSHWAVIARVRQELSDPGVGGWAGDDANGDSTAHGVA